MNSELKEKVLRRLQARIYQTTNSSDIAGENILLANGIDEAVDLVFRSRCRTGHDNVVTIAPTSGVFQRYADINRVECRTVLLDSQMQITGEALLKACDKNTRAVFIASPNYPTGNIISRDAVAFLLKNFHGLVVIDESFIKYSPSKTLVPFVTKCPNLVVINTVEDSLRKPTMFVAAIFAASEVIAELSAMCYAYNVQTAVLAQLEDTLANTFESDQWTNLIISERSRMIDSFRQLPSCSKVYPSDASFFIAEFADASAVHAYLVSKGINTAHTFPQKHPLASCLLINIGSRDENNALLGALRVM